MSIVSKYLIIYQVISQILEYPSSSESILIMINPTTYNSSIPELLDFNNKISRKLLSISLILADRDKSDQEKLEILALESFDVMKNYALFTKMFYDYIGLSHED